MQFTWSERKRVININEHGLDFVDAPSVFEGFTFTLKMRALPTVNGGSGRLACLLASRFQ